MSQQATPDQSLQTPVEGWLRHAEQQSVLFDINGFCSAARQIDFTVRRVKTHLSRFGSMPQAPLPPQGPIGVREKKFTFLRYFPNKFKYFCSFSEMRRDERHKRMVLI